MGVLDNLKAKAHAARSAAEREQRSREAHLAANARLVQPRVQSAYAYLRDVVDQLAIVPPEIERSYELRVLGPIEGLRQGEYRINTEDVRDRVGRFTFHYACSRPGRRELRLENRSAAAELRDYLANAGLRFTTREPGDRSTVFVLEQQVPVSFEFTADVPAGAVMLRARNLGSIGASVYRLTPERLDTEFLEQLVCNVLARDNRFRELCGDRLTEDSRERIRQKVRERERARKRELRRGLARLLPVWLEGESLGRTLSRTLLRRKPRD